MPITKTFNNTSFSIPLEGELNWATLSNFLVALADYSQTINKQKVGMRVAIATPVTVLATTDCVIVTDLTTPGAVAVNLPAGVSGQVFTVVDGKGDAGTNNITITPAAGLINGSATYVIDSNRAGVSLAYNGTSWTVIAEFISSGDIPRNQIAAGTANHIIINDGSGDLSSEAQLAASRGGLATDASAFSGYVKSAAGVFSAGSIAAGDLPASIDATKIADGSVTSTEFQYINTLTSNAQTQISDRVVGAASSTDNAVARFDLATGKIIQNSGIIVDDSNNVTGVNDLTVTGDLTVNGATVTVNTATLDVEDVNITVNKGGNDASSAGAGITVDRTGTKGSLVYDTTTTSKFKVGDLASEVEIATTSGAQVITNKDIDGGTAANNRRITIPKDTKTNLDALTRKEGTLVYASDLDKLYADDGSSLKEIGSGGSGINYLADYFTADTLGTVGTGNVSNTGNRSSGTFSAWQANNTSNISLSVSSTNPLRSPKNYLFTGAGNDANGSIFVESPAFQLHIADLGKPISVNFDIADVTADGNFDVCIVKYDSVGVYLDKISIAGNASGATPSSAKLPTGISKFNGFFIASSTSTDYYALRFRRLAGTDVPRLDSIKVSPEQVIQGASITDWQSYTPSSTQGFGTPTAFTLQWKQVGDSIKLRGGFTTGTCTAVEARVSLPNGYTIGGLATASQIAGLCERTNSTASQHIPVLATSGNNFIQFGNYSRSADTNTLVAANASAIFANAEVLSLFSVDIPISTLTSSVTMANRAVEEYAATGGTWDAVSSTTVYGIAGQAMGGTLSASRTKTITFQTPIQATDFIHLEGSNDGKFWTPLIGSTIGGVVIGFGFDSAGNFSCGARFGTATTNSIEVIFAVYANQANDDSPIINWPSSGAYWRVRKVSGGASVGYPVSARNIVGDVSGTTVPSGYIGEKISGTIQTSGSMTSATIYEMASIALTPGRWQLFGRAAAGTGGTPGANSYSDISISTTNSAIDNTSLVRAAIVSVSGGDVYTTAHPLIVDTSVAVTYYLTMRLTFTTSTHTRNSATSFYAVRIA